MANQLQVSDSAPPFFTAIAEDELYTTIDSSFIYDTTTWSEIVDFDAGNTRISKESGPQHSELVIHTSSSSFHVHIGEESAQGRSQGPSEQVTGSIPLQLQGPSEQVPLQGRSEQVTGSIPLQGRSEQVTGSTPLQGRSEQVTGLISLQAPSEQVTGLVSHVASQGPPMQYHQQQEQYRLLQEEQQQQEVEQQHQEHQKQLARESD